MTANEWALIDALRELRQEPGHWLIEAVKWLVNVHRSASERHPRQWILKFTGVGGPSYSEVIERGRSARVQTKGESQ